MASNYYLNDDDNSCTSGPVQHLSSVEPLQTRTVTSFENILERNSTESGVPSREQITDLNHLPPTTSQGAYTDFLLQSDNFTDSIVDTILSQGKRDTVCTPSVSLTTMPENPTSTFAEMKNFVDSISTTSMHENHCGSLFTNSLVMPERIPSVVDNATSVGYNYTQIPQMVREYPGTNNQCSDSNVNHLLLQQINSILDYNEPQVTSSVGDDCAMTSPMSDNASNFSYEDSLSPSAGQLPSPTSQHCFKNPGLGKSPKKLTKQNSEEYRKIREKNNIAVKKSREKAKQRQKLSEEKVKQLQEENHELREQVNSLTKELNTLKQLFSSVINTRPDVIEEMRNLSQS